MKTKKNIILIPPIVILSVIIFLIIFKLMSQHETIKEQTDYQRKYKEVSEQQSNNFHARMKEDCANLNKTR